MRIDGLDKDFWRGKRVLLTGHTGFKGSWAALWLSRLGADVTGFALEPDAEPNLFALARVGEAVHSHIGDLRDVEAVRRVVADADPQIVIHMAAQPLVRRSYADPVETFAVNVMGTVNLLQTLRTVNALQTVLVVTTDKVYENAEQGISFCEDDPLGGHDPYAASKAATELVAASYARSFFAARGVRLATARGGNVIGGGDFSEDRLVPDIWRALRKNEPLLLRNPEAARPWQHVLDCLCGYFTFVRGLADLPDAPAALNFGPPHDAPVLTVAELAGAVQAALGSGAMWQPAADRGPHEMATLEIDSRRARSLLGWRDQLAGAPCVQWLADWYRAFNMDSDMRAVTLDQIAAYEALSARVGQS
ncbi:CDP-glucose 4,6-dehydratase [Parvibaculum lavamentivorans DS-1]|uniref:CDP-glucose 4,6-dehydratase n=1 Tax=Parvibaculum lavamentivorans (strain DS-1 / DSM 13023 / NCIMB 13966) TaxID=402881 RepID=A7HYH3_PARL1|nr:CDP-glucose 4,6-dehydratase [Parvibaculum lavamentivorans]ABS64956.1 CDP-glucose 4,6-dehydratase [Parvibaculum lavamentivorans DS-1]